MIRDMRAIASVLILSSAFPLGALAETHRSVWRDAHTPRQWTGLAEHKVLTGTPGKNHYRFHGDEPRYLDIPWGGYSGGRQRTDYNSSLSEGDQGLPSWSDEARRFLEEP